MITVGGKETPYLNLMALFKHFCLPIPNPIIMSSKDLIIASSSYGVNESPFDVQFDGNISSQTGSEMLCLED